MYLAIKDQNDNRLISGLLKYKDAQEFLSIVDRNGDKLYYTEPELPGIATVISLAEAFDEYGLVDMTPDQYDSIFN